MEILVVCPANCATGGPEAIHEFVHRMNKLEGVHARIWYWNIKKSEPTPEEYRRYCCEYVTEQPPGYDGVLIVPEIWANRVMDYPAAVRAVWWLGVDAYAGWTPERERGRFLEDEDIVHIAQSEYAFDFLRRLGVKRLCKCTDIVNADFYEAFTERERSDVVLYNPAKITPFTRQIFAACKGVSFRPIEHMTRAEVIEAMRRSKLYIDFGEFPGRERIPREAVLQGCCIITSKIGAAAYREDFDHDYKYDSKDSHIWAIAAKIRHVLAHYYECRTDFDAFRSSLWTDLRTLEEQYRRVIREFNEVQHNHPGT